MKTTSQNNPKTKSSKYGRLLYSHAMKEGYFKPATKEGYFGKFVDFEGGEQFKAPFSALYLVVRDDKPNGDKPHTHDFDEFLSFVGLDADNPEELGAEIEICLGEEQEKHLFNKTTTIYIPKGLKHLPLTFLKVHRPFLLAHLFLTPAYTRHD